eukprot:1138666-Pelagomonas_calceolata.AAC.8
MQHKAHGTASLLEPRGPAPRLHFQDHHGQIWLLQVIRLQCDSQTNTCLLYATVRLQTAQDVLVELHPLRVGARLVKPALLWGGWTGGGFPGVCAGPSAKSARLACLCKHVGLSAHLAACPLRSALLGHTGRWAIARTLG